MSPEEFIKTLSGDFTQEFIELFQMALDAGIVAERVEWRAPMTEGAISITALLNDLHPPPITGGMIKVRERMMECIPLLSDYEWMYIKDTMEKHNVHLTAALDIQLRRANWITDLDTLREFGRV